MIKEQREEIEDFIQELKIHMVNLEKASSQNTVTKNKYLKIKPIYVKELDRYQRILRQLQSKSSFHSHNEDSGVIEQLNQEQVLFEQKQNEQKQQEQKQLEQQRIQNEMKQYQEEVKKQEKLQITFDKVDKSDSINRDSPDASPKFHQSEQKEIPKNIQTLTSHLEENNQVINVKCINQSKLERKDPNVEDNKFNLRYLLILLLFLVLLGGIVGFLVIESH